MFQVDHVIVGAGVIGLAVAERLAKIPGRSSLVLERNLAPGLETSSRNSQVIHSGIYYKPGSLKNTLCVRGRDLLYERAKERSIPHKKTGKIIFAQHPGQLDFLKNIHDNKQALGNVPLSLMSREQVFEHAPQLSQSVLGGLWSPETGIIDVHSYINDLTGSLEQSDTDVITHTRVTNIQKHDDGWAVDCIDTSSQEESQIYTPFVINCAGLYAHHIHNYAAASLGAEPVAQHFARGQYLAYGKMKPAINTLLYPSPAPELAGLGTHLTLDLDGSCRFGPDVQWISEPGDPHISESWTPVYVPGGTTTDESIAQVQSYLPDIDTERLVPDYVGVRPKLSKRGEPPADFYIEEAFPGFVSLLGIESPGITSSLAIGRHVERIVRSSAGIGRGGRSTSHVGSIDDWA